MTLPIAPSPSSSADNSAKPTPDSPSTSAASLPNNANNNNNNKRKSSRRANTAERRATHNAVERARRETLNGRFLDLAALLPNLSQIRRPSKSSIVNSSIAHVHASRRHRLLASRELRILKLESDALRRELNEWRDRAGVPRVEEPVRGDGFSMVLSGELEMLPMVGMGMEAMMDGDEDGEYGYGDDMEAPVADDYYAPRNEEVSVTNVHHQAQIMQRPPSHPQIQAPRPQVNANPNTIRTPHPQALAPVDIQRLERLGSGPIIASPTSLSFDSPSAPGMYEPRITMGDPMSGQMGYGVQGQDGMGYGNPGGFDPISKFGNPNHNQAYLTSLSSMTRSRSGSVGSSVSHVSRSSGSVSPPMSYSPDMHRNGGEQWGYNNGMGMGGQGMMVSGGMGGMGPAGVAFATMM